MNLDILHFLAPFLPPSRGAAYLDPGSGSYLIQILLAGFVGLIFVIKGYWGRIKAWFNKSTDQDDNINHEQ